MAEKELLEKRILLAKQALQLIQENETHFLNQLGSQKALNAYYIDELLDSIIQLRKRLDELD